MGTQAGVDVGRIVRVLVRLCDAAFAGQWQHAVGRAVFDYRIIFDGLYLRPDGRLAA